MRRETLPPWSQVLRALLAIRGAVRDHPLPNDANDPYTHFVIAAYQTILHRAPDETGLAHYRTALATKQQSQWSFVHELLTSNEYQDRRAGYRTPMGTLDAVRRLLIQHVLPPAEVVVDLGGGATETPEGALRFLGYPHRPRQITIVDLPPTTRLDGWWSTDEVPAVQTADGITISYRYGSMTDLHFLEDNSVDLVVSGESIEHISLDDANVVCQEVFRVLRPGGFFCLDTPNAVLTRLLSPTELIHPEHQHEYTVDELATKLEKWGFRIDRRLGLCPMPRSVEQQQFDDRELVHHAALSEDAERSFLFYLQAVKPL